MPKKGKKGSGGEPKPPGSGNSKGEGGGKGGKDKDSKSGEGAGKNVDESVQLLKKGSKTNESVRKRRTSNSKTINDIGKNYDELGLTVSESPKASAAPFLFFFRHKSKSLNVKNS
jgi:hypothetical protein